MSAPGSDPYRPQSSRHQPTRSLASEKLSQTQTEDDATMDDGDADARYYGYCGHAAETTTAAAADATRSSGPSRSPTDPASRRSPVVVEKPAADNGPGPPPDGGLRAWLIILGSCLGCFVTFGYVTAWGVFQTYYEETLLKTRSSDDIAWIGSIQFAFVFAPGVLAGRLFDYGYLNMSLLCGSALLVAATILAGQCSEYWQFVLCQGLAVGIGCGFIFSPSLSVVSHWFAKRRGFAMGFVSLGSSLGGTIIPIVVKNLLPVVGYQWTMRITGLILLAFLIIANIVLRRRFPPPPSDGRILYGLFSLDIFTQNFPFSVYAVSTILIWLGIYTVLTFLDLSAITRGMNESLAFYLVAISNVSSGVGRIFGGTLSDKIGPINIMVPATTLTVVLIYCWSYVQGTPGFIIFSILYGFTSGVFTGQLPIPAMKFGSMNEVGKRVGYLGSAMSVGILFGTPISGALINSSADSGNTVQGYRNASWWSGSIVLFGVVMMFVARCLQLKGLRGRF